MTKRLIAVLFAVVLVCFMALIPASAEGSYAYQLNDGADLLTPSEEDALAAKLSDISTKCKCNVLLVTAKDLKNVPFSFNGTADDFAKVSYVKAYGADTDGVVVSLVLSDEIGARSLGVFGSGKCVKRMNKYSTSIRDNAINKHSPDRYGYSNFFNAIADDLMQSIPPHLKWYMLPLALVIGFVIALLIMGAFKRQLKSVEMQRSAVNYVRANSMNVTASRDSYLYSTVSRTARPKNNSSGTSSSSAGGSFGGGSSRF